MRSVVRLARLRALRSSRMYWATAVAERAGDIPECFPTTPLLIPSGRQSGPTRVYRRTPRTAHTSSGGNGRHRCAQTPAAPPVLRPDDRNAAPLLYRPPCRPAAAAAVAPVVVCLSPRTNFVIVDVFLDCRPLVVNTCSVREHASYVISALADQSVFIFVILYYFDFVFLLSYFVESFVIFSPLLESVLISSVLQRIRFTYY